MRRVNKSLVGSATSYMYVQLGPFLRLGVGG